ncbi:MAG: hypothetical protein J0I21_08225 [Alphaproteobacteria bacterium]|nr:hypothetical protein [Alphaproteobacteria bacterium]
MLNRRHLLLGLTALSGFGLPGAAFAADRVDNAVVLRGAGGGGPCPVRLGRPFVQGEIRRTPQAVVEGRRVPTQANVKTRWPDGSVQHAILSFVLPRAPGGDLSVAFADAPDAPQAALTREAMLDPGYDFDAAIRITRDGRTEVASARRMLEAGDFTVWCAGPIATTIILADHSAARRWDIGPAPLRPLRPIFHATFWPALKRVEVRAIGEVANTEALADITYDLQITAGAAAPAEAYRQEQVPHYAATRWARRFWIGAPPQAVAISHNLPYLAATRAFPNFDTSLTVPEPAIARDAARWERRPKQFYDPGLWTKSMPTTGGRPDIGPYPDWVTRWLYTGDARLFAISEAQAELAGAWPMQVREGNPAKRFDDAGRVPGIGRPVSVNARPSLWLLNPLDASTPADRVPVHGERLRDPTHPRGFGGGWIAEGAHQPDPYSALYALTGDYFMLEQLQLWAGIQALKYDPAYRGPPRGAAIRDQPRGDAWVFRTRVLAAFLSPDGTAEKTYFNRLVDDAIAYWEGWHGIGGTKFADTPMWQYGNRHVFDPPLRVFAESEPRPNLGIRLDMVKTDVAVWQNYMILFELGRAKEKGYATGALLSWLAPVLIGQLQDPQHYDPYNLLRYIHPVRDASGAFYPSWAATLPAFIQPAVPRRQLDNVGDGYGAYAYAAGTMLLGEPGGRDAYAWLRDNIYRVERRRYAMDPRLAFLPRG